ncbi:translational machinery component [Exidia glandulosa HHB12029]|uniref:Translational machinery component n=1 Tax=Exidia glandulosa HHB12029 TaxID=1314781 RepID=A0A165R369_EXIGL|nr:translational machinery component [Exidia glandulosa HHB12029]
MFRVAARRAVQNAARRPLSTSQRALADEKPKGTQLGGALDNILSSLGAAPPTAPAPPPRQPAPAPGSPAPVQNAPVPVPAPIVPQGGVKLDAGDESDYAPSPSAGAEGTVFRPVRPPTADPDTRPPTASGVDVEGRALGVGHSRTALYTLHVHAGRNNTMLTLADPTGRVPKNGWISAGQLRFKKATRASYEAGYQCAAKMFRRIDEEKKRIEVLKDEAGNDISRVMEIDLKLDGYGPGRDAVYRALLTQEGQPTAMLIKQIIDSTALKIGGTRAKKRRRL